MMIVKKKPLYKSNKLQANVDTLYLCAIETFDDFGLDTNDVLLQDKEVYIRVSKLNETCMFSNIEFARTTCSAISLAEKEGKFWSLSSVLYTNGPFTSVFQRKFLLSHKMQESETINDKAHHIIGKIVSVRVIRKTVGKIICEANVDAVNMSGIIFQEFQSPSDNYTEGSNILCLARNVIQIGRKSTLLLDRMTNDFIKALFMHFFASKTYAIEIKLIIRISGLRTKIALHSETKDFDIGKIVGFGGSALQPMIMELKEKVDLVQWFEDTNKMIVSAFMPIKVRGLEFLTDKHIMVYVSEEDVVSAIGKDGLNIKMISIMLNMKVTVKAFEKQI